MSKGRKYLLAVIATLSLLILILWNPWSALLYHGDGTFTDDGLFLYPRYWIRFPDVPLNETGEHHFHFRGLPADEMSLLLYVEETQANRDNRIALVTFPVTIEAKLTDGKGNVACDALGRPAGDNRDGIWVLRSGPGEAAYWNYRCSFVRVSSFRAYDLMIR